MRAAASTASRALPPLLRIRIASGSAVAPFRLATTIAGGIYLPVMLRTTRNPASRTSSPAK